jgi:hypothetical protein
MAGAPPANDPTEHDMHERRRGGPNPALLLLIPALVILAKGASRRRAMWHEAGPAGRGELRIPPRIEATLEAWHARAHEGDGPAETATA